MEQADKRGVQRTKQAARAAVDTKAGILPQGNQLDQATCRNLSQSDPVIPIPTHDSFHCNGKKMMITSDKYPWAKFHHQKNTFHVHII